MKVFKGTDKDMKCRGMQYEIGATQKDDNAIRCGEKGFHSCEAPFDVLKYYPNKNGNRYFCAEADGKIDKGSEDTKIASSELTLKTEIGFAGLVKAQIEYTRKKAKENNSVGGDCSNLAGGDCSNLAGGDRSNLAGGDYSNLAGGDRSNLAGGDYSNLAGGDGSNLAGGYGSNLAGGDGSNLAGGNYSNLAGGNYSNLAGGDGSNLAGGYGSNLAGGYGSNLVGGNCSNLAGGNYSNLAGGKNSLLACSYGSKVKGGKGSIFVIANRDRIGNITDFVVKQMDGKTIKADVWYTLKNGELVEVEGEDEKT